MDDQDASLNSAGSLTVANEPVGKYLPGDAHSSARLAVPTSHGTRFIPLSVVLHLRADGSYTHVHCANGEHILTCKGLGALEIQLPPEHFARCHHSYTINLNKVVELVRTDGHYARLVSGERIRISRRRWGVVEQAMKRL